MRLYHVVHIAEQIEVRGQAWFKAVFSGDPDELREFGMEGWIGPVVELDSSAFGCVPANLFYDLREQFLGHQSGRTVGVGGVPDRAGGAPEVACASDINGIDK